MWSKVIVISIAGCVVVGNIWGRGRGRVGLVSGKSSGERGLDGCPDVGLS